MGKRLNCSGGKSPHKKTGITTTVVRCRECSLIFANPMPIPFDLQDHYGVLPEEYWPEEYFRINENYFSIEMNVVRRILGINEGAKALDIGAGLGKSMIVMQQNGLDAYGIEASQPFYHAAITRMGISPDKLQCSSIEDASFPDNTFDFITFGAVLEHLYDPSASILKSFQWLKPGGLMQVEVPSSKWAVGKLINLFYALRGLDYVGNISPMHKPFHLYEFGLASFQKHAQQHGYRIAFHEYFPGPTYLPALARPFANTWMKATKTGMQLCVYLQK